jgi:hypothetical protein
VVLHRCAAATKGTVKSLRVPQISKLHICYIYKITQTPLKGSAQLKRLGNPVLEVNEQQVEIESEMIFMLQTNGPKKSCEQVAFQEKN